MTDVKKYPDNAFKKVTLKTGKIVYLRRPTMRDQRMATQFATRGGQFNPIDFSQEFVSLVIVQINRVNGDIIDITNKNKIFSEILTYEEASQLLLHYEDILGLEKKPPETEELS